MAIVRDPCYLTSMRRACELLALSLLLSSGRVAAAPQAGIASPKRRNVIVFVADGLRYVSVNEHDTPALWRVRVEGVHFRNSHSLFPTFTTANASAIATGHLLGDTGDFSNAVWAGYPIFASGNFKKAPGTPVPFIENDQILSDLDDHYEGNYLGEDTLLALARAAGYNTAAIGKLGPTAIQAADQIAPHNGVLLPPSTILIDDATGTPAGVPLPPALVQQLFDAGFPSQAPSRSNGYAAGSPYDNGSAGSRTKAGTLAANVTQQQWLVDVTLRFILPGFERDRERPFALVYWSRDPDGSQHNQGDSLGTLFPGINGPTSLLGVRNADRDLSQLLAWLDRHPAVKANTDVVVTSDHGFATISRREIDRTGRLTTSAAARHVYLGADGQLDTDKRSLPFGFLAIDLASDLHLNVFDPTKRVLDAATPAYRKLHLDSPDPDADVWEHPAAGGALLGYQVNKPDGSDAMAIVAANGGSDLIYVPDGSAATVKAIVARLLAYDYVSGVFVDDRYGDIPGTLPLSAIGLVGTGRLPRPAIVVAFKVFYLNTGDLRTAIQVSDTSLQEGQGMHGGFGRDCTFNNMAAVGPDFKSGFVDDAPVGNADIVPTIAHVLGLRAKPRGALAGRVIREALAGGASAPPAKSERLVSAAAGGRQTVLLYQELDGQRYLDAACFSAPDASARTNCR